MVVAPGEERRRVKKEGERGSCRHLREITVAKTETQRKKKKKI